MFKSFKTFKYYKNTRYISLTALVAALMIVVGSITIGFKIESDVVLQLADSIFLPLIVLIPGPLTLVAAIIFGAVIDSIAGYFIVIPATIMIRVLIFIGVKLTYKFLSGYGAFALWYLLIFLYVGYNGMVNGLFSEATRDEAIIIMKAEAITDSIQYAVSVVVAMALYNVLNSRRFKPLFDFEFLKEKPIHPLNPKSSVNENNQSNN